MNRYYKVIWRDAFTDEDWTNHIQLTDEGYRIDQCHYISKYTGSKTGVVMLGSKSEPIYLHKDPGTYTGDLYDIMHGTFKKREGIIKTEMSEDEYNTELFAEVI